MKQMRFAFLEEFGEPPLTLESEVEEELVAQMAEGILEVFKGGGIRTDDRDTEEQ